MFLSSFTELLTIEYLRLNIFCPQIDQHAVRVSSAAVMESASRLSGSVMGTMTAEMAQMKMTAVSLWHKIFFLISSVQFSSVQLYWSFNPILTGLFESKFWLGGGGGQFDPPFRSGPIAAKFCMDVKTHVKSTVTTFFRRKMVYLLCYYDLCKLDA